VNRGNFLLTISELISKLLSDSETSEYLFPPGSGNISIRFAKNANGKLPARDFLIELQSSALGSRAMIKYFTLFIQLFQEGVLYNKENFKKLKDADGVHEFREFGSNTRLFCVIENTENGNEILLTHGSRKKDSKRELRTDIKKALAIVKEDCVWRK
jgi:hypothetical protein